MRRIPILVTGGAGYIGSHTCKLLSESGYLPITFDNFSQGHPSFIKWGPYVEGDLCNPQSLDQAFETYKPEAVFHFASKALVSESEAHPALYYQNNVIGSFNLLQSCVKYGVKSFVFSSTCATYGIPLKLPLSEDNSQNPINPYGRSKRMIEEMLLDFDRAYGIKSIFLRYFNAAGADLSGEIGERHAPETHLIPIVIAAAQQKLPHISVFGTDFPTPDGSAIRDYIHVMDLAIAHLKALEFLHKNRQTEAFNLGTGKGFSVWEIIKAVQEYAGRLIRIKIESRRAGDPPLLVADNEKAKKLLHWTPQYSDLATILDSAWKWHTREGVQSETKISVGIFSR